MGVQSAKFEDGEVSCWQRALLTQGSDEAVQDGPGMLCFGICKRSVSSDVDHNNVCLPVCEIKDGFRSCCPSDSQMG